MEKFTVEQKHGVSLIRNEGGPTLGMGKLSIKVRDGYAFKNLSGQSELLPYEDWRLPAEERAEDLAKRISIADIAGLMLFSPHQLVPFPAGGPFVGHYDGRNYEPGMDPSAITDEQKVFLTRDRLRNVLLNAAQSAEIAVNWNNNIQALAEECDWGIPICISSDPRHAAGAKGAEFSGQGKEVSRWPEGMGMAATFDPELMKEFARIVSKEYRALGITMALGPQIDLSTDPRWMRLEDTWGGEVNMVTAFAKAYCDGLQTTEGSENGWGKDSVAAMVKHWPGGGTGEAGRDAHYAYGKYAVYPGGRFEEHMKPFTEGAFKLDGPTGKAAAVMPYYTISWDQDRKYGENVGNAYSRYIIDDLLRKGQNYDGIICTDWGITPPQQPTIEGFASRCHGVEDISVTERHLRVIMNGVDIFGGNSNTAPILEAYEIGSARYGRDVMERRFRQSAARVLKQMFLLGLFENPYLDPAESAAEVGKAEYVEKGLDAQRRSVVLLKNKKGVLPLKQGIKLYVPGRHLDVHKTFFRTDIPASDVTPLTQGDVQGYFTLVDTPEEADAALVMMESPLSDGYSTVDLEQGGNGYLPLTLQYRPYTAGEARKTSIAGGDYRDVSANRSYKGKTNTPYNHADLDNVLNTRARMGDKPVIVVMQLHNPAVVKEFESQADGILAHFGVENKILMEVLTGRSNPGGRLPVKLPANMETVERHCEDVFDDIECHVDECGNTYDYGFGLSY